MADRNVSQPSERRAIGGELVIPAAGLVFTLYYFSTIVDSPWTAQVSAFFIGAILIALIVVFAVKSALMVTRGEAEIRFSDLADRGDIACGRLWLFLITLGYIVLIEWGGFTLTTFLFLFAGMLTLNKGKGPVFIGLLSFVFSFGGYLLFVLAFDTRFPIGPFERFMRSVM